MSVRPSIDANSLALCLSVRDIVLPELCIEERRRSLPRALPHRNLLHRENAHRVVQKGVHLLHTNPEDVEEGGVVDGREDQTGLSLPGLVVHLLALGSGTLAHSLRAALMMLPVAVMVIEVVPVVVVVMLMVVLILPVVMVAVVPLVMLGGRASLLLLRLLRL